MLKSNNSNVRTTVRLWHRCCTLSTEYSVRNTTRFTDTRVACGFAARNYDRRGESASDECAAPNNARCNPACAGMTERLKMAEGDFGIGSFSGRELVSSVLNFR